MVLLRMVLGFQQKGQKKVEVASRKAELAFAWVPAEAVLPVSHLSSNQARHHQRQLLEAAGGVAVQPEVCCGPDGRSMAAARAHLSSDCSLVGYIGRCP